MLKHIYGVPVLSMMIIALECVAVRINAFQSTRRSTLRSHSSALSSSTSPGTFWRSNQECWRPDVRDVERISFGQPAKKKGTGSRGIPARLNEDERRSFDQARRQGFLQVTGSAWRSQRSDAPLLNTYRSLNDARGRPVIVLHKLSPSSSGGDVDHADRLVVDLSPLRLPDEFDTVGKELKSIIQAEYNLNSIDDVPDDDDLDIMESGQNEDHYATRPIYQLNPYRLEWNVSRQEGKQIGKYLAGIFQTIEPKSSPSKKPKGVKPGKGRRHGGYGIG
ncbi:hypothetical protein ACHAWC_004137 [Mediolabrus comicus]